MVIVDTTVWIDYLRGHENAQTVWLDAHLGVQPLGILDLILCEVLQGVSSEKQAAAIRRKFSSLELHSTGGEELAITAARNYRLLRARGATVGKTIDCLIASHCLLHGNILLHRDRDFDPFERFLGLAVIHPSV